MTERRPDLVILCSHRANTVTGRVFDGVLLTHQRGSREPCATDLRGDGAVRVGVVLEPTGARIMHCATIRCDCGRQHGEWAPQVLRRLRGKTTTDEVERRSREFWESLG